MWSVKGLLCVFRTKVAVQSCNATQVSVERNTLGHNIFDEMWWYVCILCRPEVTLECCSSGATHLVFWDRISIGLELNDQCRLAGQAPGIQLALLSKCWGYKCAPPFCTWVLEIRKCLMWPRLDLNLQCSQCSSWTPGPLPSTSQVPVLQARTLHVTSLVLELGLGGYPFRNLWLLPNFSWPLFLCMTPYVSWPRFKKLGPSSHSGTRLGLTQRDSGCGCLLPPASCVLLCYISSSVVCF